MLRTPANNMNTNIRYAFRWLAQMEGQPCVDDPHHVVQLVDVPNPPSVSNTELVDVPETPFARYIERIYVRDGRIHTTLIEVGGSTLWRQGPDGVSYAWFR